MDVPIQKLLPREEELMSCVKQEEYLDIRDSVLFQPPSSIPYLGLLPSNVDKLSPDQEASTTKNKRKRLDGGNDRSVEEKRKERLIKNRAAAILSRQRKKEYIKNLEEKNKFLENDNILLRNKLHLLLYNLQIPDVNAGRDVGNAIGGDTSKTEKANKNYPQANASTNTIIMLLFFYLVTLLTLSQIETWGSVLFGNANGSFMPSHEAPSNNFHPFPKLQFLADELPAKNLPSRTCDADKDEEEEEDAATEGHVERNQCFDERALMAKLARALKTSEYRQPPSPSSSLQLDPPLAYYVSQEDDADTLAQLLSED